MTKHGYFILPLVLFGCEANVDKSETEARAAAAAAEQKVDVALAQVKEKAAEARKEGAEDIAKVRDEVKQRVGEVVDSGNATVLSARADALEKGEKAIQSLRETSEATRLAVEKDLAELDARVARAREKLKDQSAQTRAAEERQLAAIGQATAELRRDVRAFETTTIQSIEAFQKQLAARLSDTAIRLERIEGVAKPPAPAH